jgi:hypothetical protein
VEPEPCIVVAPQRSHGAHQLRVRRPSLLLLDAWCHIQCLKLIAATRTPHRLHHKRFGFNDNGTALVDTLWSGGSAAATDMPAIAYQLRAQGFNGIRLPFTFQDLRAPPAKTWSKQGCRKVGVRRVGWRLACFDVAAGGVGGRQPGRPCSYRGE